LLIALLTKELLLMDTEDNMFYYHVMWLFQIDKYVWTDHPYGLMNYALYKVDPKVWTNF
jgi:hypothetical protein